MIKSRKMTWTNHVARIGQKKNAYRFFVRKPEGKRPLGKSRRKWEDNIKMDLREIIWDDIEWIDLAQDRVPWRVRMGTAMNLQVPYNVEKFCK
jgi:hypothetical protein